MDLILAILIIVSIYVFIIFIIWEHSQLVSPPRYELFHKEDSLDFEPYDEDMDNVTAKDGEEISQTLEDVTTSEKGI